MRYTPCEKNINIIIFKMSKDRYYVYIMTNKNNHVLYVGMTNNIARRMAEHKNGMTEGFTKRYNIRKLVYFEEYAHPQEAIGREKTIKEMSREKKLALIKAQNPTFDDISPALL